MRSVTQLVLDTVALELEGGGSGFAPDFTLDELVRRVWERNWKILDAAGFTSDDLRAVAGGVWSWAEACGWHSVLRFVTAVEGVAQPPRRKISMQGWPAPFAGPRAGTLQLPSGRWAWIASERGDFIHVSLQHLDRPHDRMEVAIRTAHFSPAAIGGIAREPSIRWWHDSGTGVTWEVRANLHLAAHGSRDISFWHVVMGSRSVTVPAGSRLGELSDEQLRALLSEAEARIPSSSDRRESRSASA